MCDTLREIKCAVEEQELTVNEIFSDRTILDYASENFSLEDVFGSDDIQEYVRETFNVGDIFPDDEIQRYVQANFSPGSVFDNDELYDWASDHDMVSLENYECGCSERDPNDVFSTEILETYAKDDLHMWHPRELDLLRQLNPTRYAEVIKEDQERYEAQEERYRQQKELNDTRATRQRLQTIIREESNDSELLRLVSEITI